MGVLGFVTERELSNARQLLDQHLTELEGHMRELAKMNERLRKENEAMRELLAMVNSATLDRARCPVCNYDIDDCAPSCKGWEIAAMFD